MKLTRGLSVTATIDRLKSGKQSKLLVELWCWNQYWFRCSKSWEDWTKLLKLGNHQLHIDSLDSLYWKCCKTLSLQLYHQKIVHLSQYCSLGSWLLLPHKMDQQDKNLLWNHILYKADFYKGLKLNTVLAKLWLIMNLLLRKLLHQTTSKLKLWNLKPAYLKQTNLLM